MPSVMILRCGRAAGSALHGVPQRPVGRACPHAGGLCAAGARARRPPRRGAAHARVHHPPAITDGRLDSTRVPVAQPTRRAATISFGSDS